MHTVTRERKDGVPSPPFSTNVIYSMYVHWSYNFKSRRLRLSNSVVITPERMSPNNSTSS